jgi:hypothetical protein
VEPVSDELLLAAVERTVAGGQALLRAADSSASSPAHAVWGERCRPEPSSPAVAEVPSGLDRQAA